MFEMEQGVKLSLNTTGFECWLTIKDNERRLGVVEMKTLGLTSGVIPAAMDMGLHWSCKNCEDFHSDENSPAKILLNISVESNLLKDRLKQSWLDALNSD